MMEVEYKWTFQDVEEFTRYHQKHPMRQLLPTARRAFWVLVFALFLAVLTQLYFLFGPKLPEIDAQWWDAFWGGLFAGFLLSSMPLFIIVISQWKAIVRYAVRRAYNNEESRWMFAPQRMRIDAGGFTVISEYHHLFYSWSVVCKIGVSADHAFFYMTPNQAHILPVRAFRDQRHFEEFIALSRQYQQESAQQESKPTGIIASLPPESTAITRAYTP